MERAESLPRDEIESAPMSRGRFYFRGKDGEVLEADVVITTDEWVWAGSPESSSPLWNPVRVGPFFVALRLRP